MPGSHVTDRALRLDEEGRCSRRETRVAQILVVDDDADVRQAIRRILEPEGHEMLLAENGRGAMVVGLIEVD